MIPVLIVICLLCALLTLVLLALIDAKTHRLPNIYICVFLILGITFHFTSQFHFTPATDCINGIIAGAGLLIVVRTITNHIYNQDTLGLGDVKLMGVGGFWLGVDYVLLAIALGAFAGTLHCIIYGLSLSYKTQSKVILLTLKIPAGPGLIFGIISLGIFKFYTLPTYIWM